MIVDIVAPVFYSSAAGAMDGMDFGRSASSPEHSSPAGLYGLRAPSVPLCASLANVFLGHMPFG